MYPQSRHRLGTTRRSRALGAVAIAVVGAAMFSRPANAQSAGEKITRTVRRATAFAADLALGSVKPIDLEARGLTTMAFGGITVGVSAVQVLDTSALRVRAYFLNSTDAPVRIPVPPEDSFVVVDARGRRLTTLAAPKFARLPNGATELMLPPLERVEVVLLFAQIPADASEVTLKVGAAGLIRGIPLRRDATVAPVAAVAVSPATPADAGGPPPWAVSPAQAVSSAPTSPASPTSPAPTPASSAAMPTMATSAALLAGDWHEPTTLAAIHLNADGTYSTPAGPGGAFTMQGVWVVFTGTLTAWNAGRAVFSNGSIEFRWTDTAGVERHFVFARR